MMKTKRKPPSRIKYEQNNPTVSFRVSRDIYERLQDVKIIEGISNADVLKIGLGIIEPEAKEHDLIRKAARSIGYSIGKEEGYQEAEKLYKVTFRCCNCKNIIEVNDQKMREAAGKYMEEHGWRHVRCSD